MPDKQRNMTRTRSDAENHFDSAALFEFSKAINSSHELEFILGHLLLTIMGKLLSVRGIVLLKERDKVFLVGTTKGLPVEMMGMEFVIERAPRRTMYIAEEDLRKFP